MSKIIELTNPIIDFPKIKSPFVRRKINGRYVVTPQIEPGYEWVFEDEGVKAVDKLHGTNICVIVENGRVVSIDNRTTRVLNNPSIQVNQNASHARMLAGVIQGIELGYFKGRTNARIYGELIGPHLNGNIHHVPAPVFVPFDYLNSKCHWRSWIKGTYPKTFESISEWFKDLHSLYTERCFNKRVFAEGVIFLHPDGRRSKLRRDMFDWYDADKDNIVTYFNQKLLGKP